MRGKQKVKAQNRRTQATAALAEREAKEAEVLRNQIAATDRDAADLQAIAEGVYGRMTDLQRRDEPAASELWGTAAELQQAAIEQEHKNAAAARELHRLVNQLCDELSLAITPGLQHRSRTGGKDLWRQSVVNVIEQVRGTPPPTRQQLKFEDWRRSHHPVRQPPDAPHSGLPSDPS